MTDSFSVIVPEESPLARRVAIGVGALVGLVLAYVIANAVLPKGLPFGVLLQGLTLGALSSLVAMGLVLIYRSLRVVNFAQAALGGLAAALTLLLINDAHWNYFPAVLVGIAAAVFTGFLVDLLISWRFATAPRLIVTVVTIGIAQILGFLTVEMPNWFGNISLSQTFNFPVKWHTEVNSIKVDQNWLVALIVVPIALGALYWFFVRTDTGVAIRGAADSSDRAQLLGIPVRNLTRITWMVAAGLSGVGAVLSTPITGVNLGSFSIGEAMLVPLAAFVLAGMESLPMAVFWSLVIGVIQWTATYNYGGFVYAEVALLILILVGLLFKRATEERVAGTGMGSFVAVREVAPLPQAIARLREIRIGRVVLMGVIVLVAAILPLLFSATTVDDGIYVLIYSTVAVSMVILSGWAGQISLGQFALVGVGACVTGALVVDSNIPFLWALLLAGVCGALVAVVLGIPALRLEGLSLAVITLAFAVAASDYFLSSEFFHWTPNVPSSIVGQRFNLGSINTLYEFCLILALVAAVLAHNLRNSRTGRSILSVRDNARAAAAYGVSPLRSKLLAFGLAGFIAASAGAFYVEQQHGVPANSFTPDLSINVFIMVVIGGLGSITGGVIGAVYLEVVGTVLNSSWQLLATGAGVLVVLIIIPEGFGGVVFNVRDRIAAMVARRNGLTPTGEPIEAQAAAAVAPVGAGNPLAHTAALRLEALESLEVQGEGVVARAEAGPPGGRAAVVAVADIDAAYGNTQVLFDVGMGVAQREIVALLGTNGAGKTTVLRTVSGLMRPKQGRVGFLGRDITSMSPVERVQAGLVTVLGGRSVFPSLTVAENLRLASWTARRHHKDPNFAQAATERVFALFPVLRARQHQRAGLLSGGEQQMLALGQSLLCRPKLLLIDELSLGLAPTVVADLLEVIRALAASGVTVMVVEQSVNVATAISNRAIFMERGRVRFSGPTPDLSQQPQLLRSVFLRAAERAKQRKTVSVQSGVVDGPSSDDVLAALSGGSSTALPAAPPGYAPDVPALAARVPAPSATAAFGVYGVTKGYGGVAALVDVTLSVSPGEILGIIGSNGAGKTTLFDVCSGFVKPDSGSVRLYGEDVTGLSPARRAVRGLGRVFQDARVWPSMTVHEAIATALEQFNEVRDPVVSALSTNAVVRSEAKIAVRCEEIMIELGLERFRDHFVSDLSTGTRRIVELACAVASEPSVLLLDEPTSGIAQRESEALGELLLGLREQTGAAFVVIEHDVPLVSSIADRMICMHLGEIIAQGDTTDVLTNPAVVAAYLGADAAAAARSGPMPAAAGAPGAGG
jgi:ABC-type branched-subunit amino acid transport system ATPase component/ABC-type branched-subunit amino acid transport system permease subunit